MELYVRERWRWKQTRFIPLHIREPKELFLISPKRGAKIFLASFVIGYDAEENVVSRYEDTGWKRVENGETSGIPTCTHSILSGPKPVYSGISIDYRIP